MVDEMGMRYRPRRDRRQPRTRFEATSPSHARGRRIGKRGLIFGLSLLGLIAALRWYSGPDWRIEGVAVQGNEGIPAEVIIAASNLQGAHFHFADLDAAARAVDALAGVEAATVVCRWEGRATCAITVRPAQPLALWQSQYGNVWNDEAGNVQVAHESLSARLVIQVEEGRPPLPGAQLDPRLLRALRELAALQPEVTRYVYSPRFGLMWVTPQRWRVRLGDAPYDGAMQQKLGLARALQAQLMTQGRRIKALDVRFPEAPYYETAD
jgi:cell division septal protein FtsQ